MQPSENPGELLNPETRWLNEVLTNLSGLLTQRIATFHSGDRLCRGSLRPSNGWLTRLRVHALRPVPVDAVNKAQISGNRMLPTILVNRRTVTLYRRVQSPAQVLHPSRTPRSRLPPCRLHRPLRAPDSRIVAITGRGTPGGRKAPSLRAQSADRNADPWRHPIAKTVVEFARRTLRRESAARIGD